MRLHNFANRLRTIIQQRKHIEYNVRNLWNVDSATRSKLLKYYIQCWRGTTLLQEMERSCNGTIIHQGVLYSVIWHKCSPVIAYESDELLLSFRQVPHEFAIANVVLVTVKNNEAD